MPDSYLEIYGTQKTRSYSAYGQATAEIFADTRLTLGLRYTDETLEQSGRIQNLAGDVTDGPFNDELSFDPWTWRIALDRSFTPKVLGYVSYNRGFKSGGYNLESPDRQPFLPEHVDAYELGMKSEFLDRRLRLNLAVFYADYEDMQLTFVPGGAGQIFTNAGQSRTYGIDADLAFAATDNLTLTMGFGLLNAEFTDYPGPQGFTILGDRFTIDNAKGNEVPFSPPVSGNVGATYQVPTSIGDFKGTVGVSYVDKVYITAANSNFHSARTLLNASLEWSSQSVTPLSVRIWGRNLTDEYYHGIKVETSGGWYQAAAYPRMYGISLLKDF